MEFCPKCGAMLTQKGKSMQCLRCSYSTKGKIDLNISEKIEDSKPVAVVSKKTAGTLPIVGEKCKECGNLKAYFWTVQTRSGDEAETKFFRCTKCDYTWRSYR